MVVDRQQWACAHNVGSKCDFSLLSLCQDSPLATSLAPAGGGGEVGRKRRGKKGYQVGNKVRASRSTSTLSRTAPPAAPSPPPAAPPPSIDVDRKCGTAHSAKRRRGAQGLVVRVLPACQRKRSQFRLRAPRVRSQPTVKLLHHTHPCQSQSRSRRKCTGEAGGGGGWPRCRGGIFVLSF